MKNIVFAVSFTIGAVVLLLLAYLQPKLPMGLVPPSPLETWAVLSGALCVWLTVVRHVLNFPIGIVSCVLFAIMFEKVALFGDMYLQFYFIALAIHGWYWWLKGGENKTELQVSNANRADLLVVAVGIVAGIPVLVYWLSHTSSDTPIWDAVTTAGSIVAQILLNRKKIETWFIWIAVDIIYVPLYWYKDYRLTAILYAIFLIMCVSGLIDWRKEMKKRKDTEPAVA